MKADLLRTFLDAAGTPDQGDLAGAALVIARLAYPHLDAGPYLKRLDAMAAEARARVATSSSGHQALVPDVLNQYLFGELGFAGNEENYHDPRNSLLNDVLDRRTGIPITLATVYIEVARRAGFRVEGVNFPGHFLLRWPASTIGIARDLILDPFHHGTALSESDCRELLRRSLGDEAAFDRGLLATASKPQILVRMLVNLKQVYVHMRSFPQARDVTELLLALDPSALTELRDRGLLAYHLKDYAAALRDLEAYLNLASGGSPPDAEDREERNQIWEHVKALRRRVASLN